MVSLDFQFRRKIPHIRSRLIYTGKLVIVLIFISGYLNNLPEPVEPAELPKDDPFTVQKYYMPSEVVLNPLSHSFMLSNEHICKDVSPYMIVVVPSRLTNFERRRAIRETYGTISSDRVSLVNDVRIQHAVRLAFVIGTSDNKSIEMEILAENRQYRDLVQVDMVDSYHNLTLKVLMAFKWVDTYCPSAKYVLKADDDTFVHVGILLKQIHNVEHSIRGNVFGFIFQEKEHLFVHRNDSKWSVSKGEYPLSRYPIYAQGTSYTITGTLIPKIINTAKYLPYLHIEDVFITGVIAGQFLGAQHVSLNETSRWLDEIPVPCEFAENHILARSQMTPDLFRRIWKALLTNVVYCKLFRGRKPLLR